MSENQDGLSDFMKFVYEHGGVKDISEAFEEFPVEEEWHKGKVENVVCEDSEIYSIYEIGDIVFVKDYYYFNGEKGNNHMFVIIDQNNTVVPLENFGMILSSRLEKLKFDSNVLLKKDEINKLKVDSIVKTDTIYKVLNEQILFKVGKVDIEKVEEYKKKYAELHK